MQGLCFTREFTFSCFTVCNSLENERKAQPIPIRKGLNTFHSIRLEIYTIKTPIDNITPLKSITVKFSRP